MVIAIRNQPGQLPTAFTFTSGKPTSNSHMRVGSVSNRGSSNSDDLDTVRFTGPLCRARDLPQQAELTPRSEAPVLGQIPGGECFEVLAARSVDVPQRPDAGRRFARE